ncbi:hypothetical protein [Maridesulfovibrio sp. FT414]|uniref:hypothetical protein n=1 Tax=Maridesulfovibrio sp. FT414 TaxID=2979469 RepID=UPI003D803A89
MRKYIVFTLFILLGLTAIACAQDEAGDNGNGFGGLLVEESGVTVNWGDGFVSATSEILPMQDTIDPIRTKALAVRQGGVESRKRLLDAVLGLSLDGRTFVAEICKDDPKALSSLRGLIQNSLLNTAENGSGAVAVTASVSVRNGIASVIISPTIPFLSGIAPTISGKRADGTGLHEVAGDEEMNGREAGVYSGIVIDARGFNLTPVLLPLIYDGRGVGVYGAFAVSREAVMKNGLVSYMVNSGSENFKARVGKFPLTVKPVNTQGAGRTNLILSLEDGAKVRSVLKRKSVVENCAVVILVSGASSVQEDGNIHEDVSTEAAAGDAESGAGQVPHARTGIQEEALDGEAVPAQQ